MSGEAKRLRWALALAVGVVLADSSVVVLALPEIYRELDVSVTAVTWVLVAFNLVLALAALPAAGAARRLGAARVGARRGSRSSATASSRAASPARSVCCSRPAACRLWRCRRGVRALELLPSVVGSERRAATVWAASARSERRSGRRSAACSPS